MPRQSQHLQKHTLRLYEGDFEKLGALYPNADTSMVLRNMLRDFIRKTEANVDTSLPEIKEDIHL